LNADSLFLGIIALAVAVMAAIQVGAVMYAIRLARRVEQVAGQIERDIRPMVANLNALSADAARAAALAATQVERADQLFGELADRIDQTVTTLQRTVVAPAREGFAVLAGLRAALAAFRELREARSRSAVVEDEDALFIG
jgi:hypothetical protein